MMMNEQDFKIEEVSIKVDELLVKLCEEYEMAPLNISAIILGRIYMLNEVTGTQKQFKELIDHVLEISPTEYTYTKPTLQ